jgi:hypothetical protein
MEKLRNLENLEKQEGLTSLNMELIHAVLPLPIGYELVFYVLKASPMLNFNI